MPWGSVVLKPGVDVELTATANVAGYSESRLIRFKSGLAQKIGGWTRFYANAVGGIPRGLHAWQDLNEDRHLAVGTTTTLGVITDSQITVITPQTLVTNSDPDIETTASSANVSITDPNIANVTDYDFVEFLTPVSVGGLILSGVYPIDVSLSTSVYRIIAASEATTSANNFAIGGATQANPCVVSAPAHNFANGDLIYISDVAGMTELNNRLFTAANVVAGVSFELSGVNSTAYTAYSSGGLASGAAVPFFTTVAGSSRVTVTLQSHGLVAGNEVVFPVATTMASSVVTITVASPGVITWFYGSHGMTGGESIVFSTTGALPTGLTAGVTYYVLAAGITATTFRVSLTPGGSAVNTSGTQSGIQRATVGSVEVQGTYRVTEIVDVDNFIINISSTVGASSVVAMNGGDVRLQYYIALGPAAQGIGYSVGTYSDGTYSIGASGSAQEGTPITATDWTIDNWGSTILACPEGGGIYEWTPDTGLETAKMVDNAPPYNGGIFVANPAQILIAWGSTQYHEIGVDRDPLTYAWSDQLDYSFWSPGVVNPATGLFSQAGSARIPTGSKIVAGLQAPQQSLLWTDLDLWALNYIGNPQIGTFGQTKIASSCGAIGSHAVAQMGNGVYWMGRSNFFALTGNGVTPMPCSVWDAVFQDLDTENAWKARACPNTPFNEMMWEYPSESGGTGENDSYVKVNILDGSWDVGPIGSMPRSAWIDQSVLGMPIGASPQGVIYQHETTEDADGQPISWSFTTGYWVISEGQEVAFVDMVVPDFKYGLYNGNSNAAVQITLYSVMYPGGSVRTYGPYTVTSSSTEIRTRIRGRQMSMQVSGSDLNSFVRLGRIKFQFARDGRF